MQWVRRLPAISGHSSARGPICLLILHFHDFKEVSTTTELATVSQRRNPVNGSSNLRDVRHEVGAAHDGKLDAERHLRGRMPQPLRDHVQRDPRGGQPVTGTEASKDS